MIDLFSVKLNNNYDEIGTTPTIENGTFLCDTTSENYTRGYSYQISTVEGEKQAARIEQTQDYKIKNAIYPTIQNVCGWINNWFYPRIKHPCGSYINPPICCENIKTGDLLHAYYCKGNFIGYATVTDGVITLDNPLFNPDIDYTYYIMVLPQDVESAISQIIFYDVFTRGIVDGLKSESVGNYSYTKDDVTVGTLAYPKALISGLEANYRKLRFVQ